jgi:hypothetical protein
MLAVRVESFQDWRPHDQRCFISANEGLISQGWSPQISARMAVPLLVKAQG